MKEIWKDIPVYKGYEASNFGRIRNKKTNNILQGTKNFGYLRVTINYNGKKILARKHRLIAQTFIPNPNNYCEVNHKDGNKQNNIVDNLEWCNRKQNAMHSVMNGLQKTKNVKQYSLEGNFIKEYFNANQAQNETNIFHITDVCNGKRKTAGGFYWKYVVK